MVVDQAAGKVDHLLTRRGDPGLPRSVGKAQDRVGVGDVEIIADQHHTERRVQMVDKY